MSLGNRIADAVVGAMGSWTFIITQTAIVTLWVILNGLLLSRHPFDPYPFILLNLGFSTQAAYASPLILMSQKRAALRDQDRTEREQARDREQMATEAAEVHAVDVLQGEQMEILRDVQQILHALAERSPGGQKDTR